jgi:hypothetical protein
MERFLAFTTQKEPALTASFLAAILLAIAARYLGLTDEDLAILGPVALILAGVVIRTGVFSPATVDGLLDDVDGLLDEESVREARDGDAPLPGLPARHLASWSLRRMRRWHDDPAWIRCGVAQATHQPAVAPSYVPMDTGRREASLRPSGHGCRSHHAEGVRRHRWT